MVTVFFFHFFLRPAQRQRAHSLALVFVLAGAGA